MPIYEYKCTSCNNIYDIFHKGKESIDNILCPNCASKNYKKMISVSSINMANLNSKINRSCEDGSCDFTINKGGCSSGICGN